MYLNRNEPATAALIQIGWPQGIPDDATLLAEAAESATYMSESPTRARDWVIARAAVHAIALQGAPARVPVERVECVDWSQGHEQPADPLWRIALGGYCADFPSEQAALNFASQIEALIPRPSRQAAAVLAAVAGDTEAPEYIRPLSWLEEAVRELKRRGPGDDCEDPDAFRDVVGETEDLLNGLKAAMGA